MKKKILEYIFPILFLFLIVLWAGSWIFVDILRTSDSERALFADKFGFINSLFSALTLAGIIYSIFLQKQELGLQRRELKDTRKEFSQQNFENLLFNLTNTQNELVKTISAPIVNLKSFTKSTTEITTGRAFFIYARIEMKHIYNALNAKKFGYYDEEEYERLRQFGEQVHPDEEESNFQNAIYEFTNSNYSIDRIKWKSVNNLEPVEVGRLSYSYFFNRYSYVLSHYFRHLYHILKYLKTSEEQEIIENRNEGEDVKRAIVKKFHNYSQFVQAQMSTPELMMLFYNCLTFPKLLKLVIKYQILENCSKEDLIDERHNCVPGIILKGQKDILGL